jgi:hypothetical protein
VHRFAHPERHEEGTTMTNFTKRIMTAAVTLTAAAGLADAQTMKAEIPFTFRAGDMVMAAGTYEVTEVNRNSGQHAFRIAGADGRHAMLLLANSPRDTERNWEAIGKPVLGFDCGGAKCALIAIWTGPRNIAYSFNRPKLGRDEAIRMAVVVMRPATD